MLMLLAQSLYLPPRASTVAPEVDWLFNTILAIIAFFCLLIFALMVAFSIKYRHRPGGLGGASPGHSTALELTWTIIPIIIVLTIFYYGFRGYLKMTVVPPNAYEIQVRSWMWGWGFVYPNGVESPELHIPKDRPIRVVLTSEDVIHSLYIPAFRVQKSSVPGRFNRFWFEATKTGEYPIYCAQYCGTNHSEMLSKVVVHDPAGFAQWMEIASNPEKQAGFTPVKAGEQIYRGRGCAQCHSIDGAASTGPTFKNLFGHEVQLASGGSVTADENYLRESIVNPQAKIVKGFQPVMPSFANMREREIGWVIDFIKSKSDSFNAANQVNQPKQQPTQPTTAPANR
jgi:cytochrome c oxidase subunit 2